MIFARWALSVSALGIIGAFGATLLNYPADPRVISIGRRASLGLLTACFLIITAQLYAWFGVEGLTDPANVWTMLSITLWGLHWAWMAGAAVAVAVLLVIAGARPSIWIFASGAAAAAVTATVPLVGHGGTQAALTTWLHRAHLLGAGLWIGSLLVAVLANIGDTPRLLSSLRRFAPIAFTGAALIAACGLMLAWERIRPLSTLWTIDYGPVFFGKVLTVLVVGSLGFVNWRRPRLGVVIVEVTIAIAVVLSLTALLSELQMPGGH